MILTTLIYWLNGLLAGLYLLADHGTALLGAAVAGAVALCVDAPLHTEVAAAPRRYDRAPRASAPAPRLSATCGVGLLWTLAAWITPPPVPFIGLTMWLGALFAPLALPFGRRKLAHRLRWFIAVAH